METIKPYQTIEDYREKYTVFLAGHTRDDWRDQLVEYFDSEKFDDLILINPVYDDWESLGEEDPDNPKMVKQWDWEHEGLIAADLKVFNFSEHVAPVSLYELGRYQLKGKTIILVEDKNEKAGYLRWIACKYGLTTVENLKELSSLISMKYHIS